MSNIIDMTSTQCALCLSNVYDRELYPASFTPQDLSARVFSARRLPDRVHYRIVICRQCGLVRSNPILKENDLVKLYTESHFTYSEESIFAAHTYAQYFKKYLGDTSLQARILEIGCGNGTFLNELHQKGYTNLAGVEPSTEAIAHAGTVKEFIHHGMFGPNLYPPQSFDVICAFQLLDHIASPNEFLKACHKSLKPGGKLFLILHDIHSPLARLLGKNCPMVDIEHPFLYNKNTLQAFVHNGGFHTSCVFTVTNRYPLSYWTGLIPMPYVIKSTLVNFIKKTALGKLPIRLSLGNMGIMAIKKSL